MKPFSPVVLQFESLPSTNTEAARQAAAGAGEGLCIVAREQTAGRGRFDRAWISPKDAGLYVSIVLRPKLDQQDWPLVTLAASLAVYDALAEVLGVHTDIKWPNDIMHNEQKLCGILAETAESEYGRALVVGIGINLTDDAFPAEIRSIATSVEEISGRRIEPGELLNSLLSSFGYRYQSLQDAGGKEKTLSEWSQHSSYAFGKAVSVVESVNTFSGITRGLESDGALRVETGDGNIATLRAGEIKSLRPGIVNSKTDY